MKRDNRWMIPAVMGLAVILVIEPATAHILSIGAAPREISCGSILKFRNPKNPFDVYAGDKSTLTWKITNSSNFLTLTNHRAVDSGLGVVHDPNISLDPEESRLWCHEFTAPRKPGLYNRRFTWSAQSSNGIVQTLSLDYQLRVSANPHDTDLDGMPNVYEILHGLDPGVDDAGLDLDDDGYTNFEESLFGTPANNNAQFPQTLVERSPDGGINLIIPTYPGNFYHFETSDDGETWAVEFNWRAGAGSTRRVVPLSIDRQRRFFRFRAQLVD